ncbi:hypothetical protein HCB26_09970 [Listeria booriae]|uniref:Uncharacterized protein n=1 Tax=Listeria booriae TaxID=1552123 RepID=A0A7X0Z0A4_9LIST|nr:hypothetical protein [Listeria booriae]MBC2166889.1 hypothetical protein [Listeria booriae]MBC2170708.1 hypothetical protein [Listeria booriae]
MEFILCLVGGITSSIIGITILESKASALKKIIGMFFFLGLGSMLLKNAWESGKIFFG